MASMSSKKRDGKPSNVASSASLSSERVNVSNGFTPTAAQLVHGMAEVSLDCADGGEWEVPGRKLKNDSKSGSNTWAQMCANAKPWTHPDASKFGMHDNNTSWKASDSKAQGAGISAPLEGGWNWHSREGVRQLNQPNMDGDRALDGENGEDDCGDSDIVDDDDDDDGDDDYNDDIYSDGFDSDESQKSHNTQKMSKWFRTFFNALGKLTVSEISEPTRQWHCPACQGGPGAIDWFVGLMPLLRHAKTKGSQRVKLHREFANILTEELDRIGASAIPAGESLGRWNGLETQVRDYTIVWPPMVIIMNTQFERDDREKWTGMGNQELLDYFSTYDAVKARHSYGPQGHRGIGLLFFEPTAVGYLEAERLHKHFETQQKDRYAWEHHRNLFYPGGKRQLYGFLASKEDMEIFNQHVQGKARVKYEVKSYQEMVVKPMKRMDEDNQLVTMYKDKANRLERKSKVNEKSFKLVSEKLRKTVEEHRIVRQRTRIHHEQNKEEMDSQEKFFSDQLEEIHRARDANDEEFEKLKQEEREKAKRVEGEEGVKYFINCQEEGIVVYVNEREKLMKAQEEKMGETKRRHMEELLELEKKFSEELAQLMEKYS